MSERVKADDPLMPAFLAAKDAYLDNRSDWNSYERTGRVDDLPVMPWIAIVKALDAANLLQTIPVPVFHPTPERRK